MSGNQNTGDRHEPGGEWLLGRADLADDMAGFAESIEIAGMGYQANGGSGCIRRAAGDDGHAYPTERYRTAHQPDGRRFDPEPLAGGGCLPGGGGPVPALGPHLR